MERDDDLIEKLDEWVELGRQYAGNLEQPYKMIALRQLLPVKWKSKILERPELRTVEDAVRFIQ